MKRSKTVVIKEAIERLKLMANDLDDKACSADAIGLTGWGELLGQMRNDLYRWARDMEASL